MSRRLTTYKAALVLYYLTLSLYFVGRFFPDQRLWGLSLWAHLPVHWSIIALIIAAATPFVIDSFTTRTKEETGDTAGDSSRFLVTTIILTIAFAILFIICRTQTHFLGDGYSVIGTLAADDPLIKYRGALESLSHLWLSQILPGDPQAASQLSFRVISIGSGLIFLTVLTFFARLLFESYRDRTVFWLGAASGGYMLLYFGYVEFYSMFVTSVAAFTLAALAVVRGKISRWWPVLFFLLSAAFHVLGIVLLPALLYLLLFATPPRRLSKFSSRRTIIAVLAAMGIAAIATFAYLYSSNLFFRFAFLPLFASEITIDNYTLFSAAHLGDWLNLIMLLSPSIPIPVVLALTGRKRAITGESDNVFLLILSVSVAGVVFVLDPKLGMPRDWDLFSFAGMPLTISCFYFLVRYRSKISKFHTVAALAVGLGFLALIPRVATQAVPEAGVSLFKSYRDLDLMKSRNGQAVLVEYYRQVENFPAHQTAEAWRRSHYPQVGLQERAVKLIESGRSAEALPMVHRMLKLDPMHWNAWTSLGVCYYNLKQSDSAVWALEIAQGMNPFGGPLHTHLGYAYFGIREFDKAEDTWLEALKLDKLMWSADFGLAAIYTKKRDSVRADYHLERAAMADQSSAEVSAQAGSRFANKGEYDKAAFFLKRAMARGFDSSLVEQLYRKYPKLRH